MVLILLSIASIHTPKEDDLSIYKLDEYDKEDEQVGAMPSGLKGLAMFASNTDDPYVTLKDEVCVCVCVCVRLFASLFLLVRVHV